MSSTIRELARRAGEIFEAPLPGPVAERARLQHLSLAGAVQVMSSDPGFAALAPGAGSRGAAALCLGGRAPRREAVRLHVAMAGALELDDVQLGGRVGAVAVPVAWAFSRGQTLDALVRATVAANEVAGRLGLSLAMAPAPGRGQLVVSSWAAVIVAGLLGGLNPPQLASALALASVGAGSLGSRELLGGDGAAAISQASAAVAGLDAVELARAGASGPLDLLDARGGLLDRLSPVPLRHAFTGWGRAWLSMSSSFPAHPLALPLQSALQGVEEVLARHVKAADKRLRADQVERIEVRLGAVGFGLHGLVGRWPAAGRLAMTSRLPEAIGLMLAEGAYDAHLLRAADRPTAQREAIAQVASKVHLSHDMARTMRFVDHLVEVLGPLLAGLGAEDLRRAAQAREDFGIPALPGPQDVAGLVQLARLRPAALAERLRYRSGDLGDARLDELQLLLGADVRVQTTRGGSWPEHREVPIGSPGWSWADTVARVERRAPAAAVAGWQPAEEAEPLVEALIAGGAGPDSSLA